LLLRYRDHASRHHWPCPFGAPPRAPWKRQTFHPRTAGALQRLRVLLDMAVQRGAFWKAYSRFLLSSSSSRFMGLSSLFLVTPTPRRDIPHNRLCVVVHGDMLNSDLLLSTSAHNMTPQPKEGPPAGLNGFRAVAARTSATDTVPATLYLDRWGQHRQHELLLIIL
jgi:hypothetical protein